MATLITNNTAGNILIQTGVGIPNHVAPKGSQFTDITTANLYINKDGIINWVLNIDTSNSGATSNIYSFNTFSSTTVGQTFVSTSIANDTIILSGIGLNILTDDVNNVLTFSSTTGTDTYVTGGTYNPSTGIATFTNNSGSGFDVTGITDNYWTSGSTGNYSIKAKNDSGLDATGNYAVAEGEGTLASGISSHAEGGTTISSGQYSHAEGSYSLASGNQSHAEGFSTSATGITAHAEGNYTIAGGNYSHAEGNFTKAYGNQSHAEGNYTIASGNSSHAEGESTIASGDYSHAGGDNSVASGTTSFVHSSNSFTNSDYSAILGGYNNIIPYGIINSIILGGDSITATTSGTTFVEGLNIKNTQNDNSITKLLTVDNTGLVKYRDASSIIVSDTYVTGGTYNGGTATFTNNTGGTFNVNGFYTGATDVYVTGLTFNPSNYDLTISRNDNVSFTESLAILSSDMVVTGGTYNPSTGIATFTNNSGGTFNVSGFLTGMTDTYVTGLTYSNNLITLKQNGGQPNLSILIDNMSGLTINGALSATTYYNLPTDIRVTGGTYSNGTIVFTNNTGGTFNVTGLSTGNTDTFVTGGTYSNGTTTFRNNTGGTFNVTGYYTGATDVYTTGATYSNNTFTHTNNTGGTYNVSFNSVTGLTVNGNLIVTGNTITNTLSATSISGTSFYGDGSNLTNISATATKFTVNCRNQSGSDMYKGMIVYISGSTGNKPTIQLAKANSEMTSARTFGALEVDIANNADGTVVVIGSIQTLDTRTVAPHPFTVDTLNDGDTLYLSPVNAGYVTNIKPYAPNHLVYIGKVIRTTPTNGYIEYQIQNGYELNELHDVMSTGATFGDILSYSGYNGYNVWTSTKTLNGSYTITGNTTIGGTMQAETVSATTYQNLPTDIRVTGATYNNNTFTYTNNTGGTFNVLFNSVTGLTVDGTLSATTISGATIYANDFPQLPYTDNQTLEIYTLGGYDYLRLKDTISAPSGGTRTFNGNVAISSGLTSTTISATTYQNLPTDIRVTGGTYSSGTATFTNNTGGTFNVTGFYTSGSGSGDFLPLSGGTVTGSTTFTNGLTANTISATTYQNLPKIGFSPINVGVCDTAPTAASTQYYYQTIAEVTTTLSKVKLWGYSGSDLVLFGIYRGALQGSMTLIGQARKTCGLGPNELTLTAETGQNLSVVAGEDLVVGYYPDGTSWRTVYDVGISDIYFGITNTTNITTMPATPTGTATGIRFACTLY